MEPGTGSQRHVPIPATGLTTVVEPPQPLLDIVFVHGFTGHPERTWTKKKGDMEHADDEATASSERPKKMRKFNVLRGSGSSNSHGYRSVFWPRDLLPATAPDARVMTYGYDTKIRHWIGPQVSQNTVYDIAWDFLVSLEASRRMEPQRPIMFIAHSLGGIVVKEMLRRSSMCILGQSHLNSVFNATTGIMFFGTPHGGSDPRGILQSVAERLIKAVGFTVNQQIVDTLLPSSERLRELRDEFAPLASQQGWTVHSFQEQMGVKPLNGRKVVDDTSSYINAPEVEIAEHIGQNHMEMCRFGGSYDPEYRKVSAAITRIISRRETTMTNTGHTREPEIDHGALQKILDSLVFDQHDARHQNIKSAHAKTCKWLLKSNIYGDWVKSKHLEENHGFFWMKGKPGTGKSTIMKFLFANARRTMKDKVLISFFFNARGHKLERSTTGLYRSLLLQILEQKPSLQPVLGFDSLRNRDALGWSLELLKSLFEQAVQSLAGTPVVCFVDALDECPETEVREMVSSFSHLGQQAVSAGHEFKVCFSSRHYPHITINNKTELILEEHEGHGKDISLYVESELKIGQSKLADEIRQTVQTKSSGIFMWVVLVVQILNKEHDSGNVHKLRRRLKEIPEDLHDLFRDILTRDARNAEELVLCLQWVLFAKDPLNPKELYFAILSGADSEAIKNSDMEELSDSVVDRYILNCSKGLIETTKSKSCTAQFIHESVRDFLLKDSGLKSVLAKHTNQSFEGISHERLKQCCLVQMEIADPDNDPNLLSERFPFLRYAVNNVLHHANRAEQLGISQSEFLTKFQTAAWVKLNNLCEKYKTRKYPSGARLLYILAEKNFSHLITMTSTDSSYLKMGEERYLCPLYAAIAMGSHEAAKVLLWRRIETFSPTHEARRHFADLFSRKDPWPAFSRESNLSKKTELYDKISQSSEELTLFFLHAGLLSDEKNHTDWGDIIDCAGRHRRELVLHEIMKIFAAGQIVSRDCGLLHMAAKWNLLGLVSTLLENATYKAEIDAHNKYGRTPLSYAAGNYSAQVTKLLLETGLVDVDSCDNGGRTPLSQAASGSHDAKTGDNETVIKLLLDWGKAEIGLCDNAGKSPLFWTLYSTATQYGMKNMEILLSYGKEEAKRRDHNGLTCLSHAIIEGQWSAIDILLTSGEADVDARDSQGRTPLSLLAGRLPVGWPTYRYEGETSAFKTLIKGGADINTQDDSGRTPLSWFITDGKPYRGPGSRGDRSPTPEGVRLLLELGANPRIPDFEGLTPCDLVGGDREQEVRNVLVPLTFDKSSVH